MNAQLLRMGGPALHICRSPPHLALLPTPRGARWAHSPMARKRGPPPVVPGHPPFSPQVLCLAQGSRLQKMGSGWGGSQSPGLGERFPSGSPSYPLRAQGLPSESHPDHLSQETSRARVRNGAHSAQGTLAPGTQGRSALPLQPHAQGCSRHPRRLHPQCRPCRRGGGVGHKELLGLRRMEEQRGNQIPPARRPQRAGGKGAGG